MIALSSHKTHHHSVVAYGIMLMAFGLLVFQLDAKSLSGDEIGNVLIERDTLADVFTRMASTWSQHPPGSHFVMYSWIKFTGQNDFTVRFPAVLWAALNVALLYRLARRWFGPSVALTAMLLFALAPDLILYGRMEKYYSLAIMLVLISLLAFADAVRRPHRRAMWRQGLLTLLLLYTDYFAALFVAGALNLIVLFMWRRERVRFMQWIVPQITAGILFVPFATIGLAQIASVVSGAEADLASGWLAVLSKLLYFPYAYSVGETVFPWMLTAVFGGALFGVMALLGISSWLKKSVRYWAAPNVWVLFILSVTWIGSVGLTSVALKTVPLITLPNHVLFALPLFLLAVAAGLQQTGRWRKWFTSLAVIVLLPSLLNYYSDQQFHNPVFVTPSREVMRYISEHSGVGDVLISDDASGVQYYYDQWNLPQPVLLNQPIDSTQLNASQFKRVWLVTVGRDRTRPAEPDPQAAILQKDWQLVDNMGFGEQDATYRSLKSLLTKRPAYQYRVVVQLFQRPDSQ